MWTQRCELLFTGPMAKIEKRNTMQTPPVLVWRTRHGTIQQLGLIGRWTKETRKPLAEIWKLRETSLKRADRGVGAAEFIAKLRILVKEANYPADHYDRFLRDFLVLGMNSDRVRKDCFKEGNALTFNKAREMAKTEESADKQLRVMNTQSEVHPISSMKRNQHLRDQPNAVGGLNSGKPGKTCRNCVWGPHSWTVSSKKCNMPLLPKGGKPSQGMPVKA